MNISETLEMCVIPQAVWCRARQVVLAQVDANIKVGGPVLETGLLRLVGRAAKALASRARRLRSRAALLLATQHLPRSTQVAQEPRAGAHADMGTLYARGRVA